jgi:hypothetical protein
LNVDATPSRRLCVAECKRRTESFVRRERQPVRRYDGWKRLLADDARGSHSLVFHAVINGSMPPWFAPGIATFLTGMHPDLSSRDYPYLVTLHALHIPYHTANRIITWPQRGCSGHLQTSLTRSWHNFSPASLAQCSKTDGYTCSRFPGKAQHLLWLHNDELADPSVTQRNATGSSAVPSITARIVPRPRQSPARTRRICSGTQATTAM